MAQTKPSSDGETDSKPAAAPAQRGADDARLYLAVDVGGTKILAALAEESGVIRGRHKIPTPRGCTCEDVLAALSEAIAKVLEGTGASRLQAAGVAVPGVVDPKRGTVLVSPNLPIDGANIAEHVDAALGANVPVAVGNDGNLAALGESWLGTARGAKSAVAVFVGTGIGGGYVSKGTILRGSHNGALEVGHLTVQLDGPRCGCGNRGCLEALASRTAMERDIREAILAGRESVLPELLGGDMSVIKSGALNRALQAEDAVVTDVLRRAAEVLGYGCMSIAHLLDPEVIVLGGGVMEACGWFLLPIIERVLAEDGLIAGRPPTRARLAALGDDAVVLGALAAARIRAKRSPFRKKYAVLPGYPRVELAADGFRVDGRTCQRDVTVRGNGKLKKAKIPDPSLLEPDAPRSIPAKVVRKACKGAPEVLFVGAGADAEVSQAAREFCEAHAVELRVLGVAEAVAAYNDCPRRKAVILCHAE